MPLGTENHGKYVHSAFRYSRFGGEGSTLGSSVPPDSSSVSAAEEGCQEVCVNLTRSNRNAESTQLTVIEA